MVSLFQKSSIASRVVVTQFIFCVKWKRPGFTLHRSHCFLLSHSSARKPSTRVTGLKQGEWQLKLTHWRTMSSQRRVTRRAVKRIRSQESHQSAPLSLFYFIFFKWGHLVLCTSTPHIPDCFWGSDLIQPVLSVKAYSTGATAWMQGSNVLKSGKSIHLHVARSLSNCSLALLKLPMSLHECVCKCVKCHLITPCSGFTAVGLEGHPGPL